MNPDMVVGLLMIIVAVAGLVVGFTVTIVLLGRDSPDPLNTAPLAAISGSNLLPPIPVLPVVDQEQLLHDRCDECGEPIDETCPHGRSLCVDDALWCDECLIDLRCQGVLSQYVTGTFPGPGAA